MRLIGIFHSKEGFDVSGLGMNVILRSNVSATLLSLSDSGI